MSRKCREQYEVLSKENKELVKENKSLRNKIEEMRQELEDIKMKRRAEIEKYKSSFDEMDVLVEKEKQAHKYKESKLKEENNKLLEQIERLKVNIKELQKEKTNQELYRSEIQNLQSKVRLQVAEAETRIKQAEIDYEERNKEVKIEISVLQNKVRDLELINDKLKTEAIKLNQYQSLFNIEKDKVILTLNIEHTNQKRTQ